MSEDPQMNSAQIASMQQHSKGDEGGEGDESDEFDGPIPLLLKGYLGLDVDRISAIIFGHATEAAAALLRALSSFEKAGFCSFWGQGGKSSGPLGFPKWLFKKIRPSGPPLGDDVLGMQDTPDIASSAPPLQTTPMQDLFKDSGPDHADHTRS